MVGRGIKKGYDIAMTARLLNAPIATGFGIKTEKFIAKMARRLNMLTAPKNIGLMVYKLTNQERVK